MKRIHVIACAILAVVVMAIVLYVGDVIRPHPYYGGYVTALMADLQRYKADPLIGNLAKQVIDQSEKYEDLLQDNILLAKDYDIHVVAMVHGVTGQDAQWVDMVGKSQSLVNEYLSQINPDVIATETYWEDAVLPKTIPDDKKLLQVMGLGHLYSGKKPYEEPDGVMMYLDSRPKAMVVGAEDIYLLALETKIDINLPYLSEDQASDLSYLHGLVRAARSEIALAKLVKKLREKRGYVGAIVMGGAHEQDFGVIEVNTGMRFRHYQAVPQNR